MSTCRPSGATCLPANCCVSDLPLWKSNSACWPRTKQTLLSHQKLTCSFHDTVEKYIVHLVFNNNHSIREAIDFLCSTTITLSEKLLTFYVQQQSLHQRSYWLSMFNNNHSIREAIDFLCSTTITPSEKLLTFYVQTNKKFYFFFYFWLNFVQNYCGIYFVHFVV
jgi:hypothetical protein